MTTNTPLVACPECDCLQHEVAVPLNGKAECARCGAELWRNKPASLERTLAFLMGAAMLFLVANAFPIMRLDAQGMETSSTLAGTAWALHREGMSAVAMLVAVTAIVAPAMELAVMLYLLVPLRVGVVPQGLPIAFRMVSAIEPWGMVEVFMLGALVALVKLKHVGSVHPGVALYAMAGFIVLLSAGAASFEPRALWHRVEALRSR